MSAAHVMSAAHDRGGDPSSSVHGPRLRMRQVVLDAVDHRGLAEFYRRLLGADYVAGNEPGNAREPEFIEVRLPDTGVLLTFQADPRHRPPDWPGHRHVPTQAHIDIDVPGDQVDEAVELAESLGARLVATDQRDEGMVVMTDPAGHPFCYLFG